MSLRILDVSPRAVWPSARSMGRMLSGAHDRALGRVLVEHLPRLPQLVLRAVRYRAARDLGYVPKPRRFVLFVTRRCSMRCAMCSVILTRPTREPTAEEVYRIFSEPVLDRLDSVVISGGEPTLRQDLAEIVEALISASPRLEEVWITTNAGAPDRVERQVLGITRLPGCDRLKKLGVQISIDGHGAVHEQLRKLRRGTFAAIIASIGRLKAIAESFPLALQINCTVQRGNADHLQEVADFAEAQGVPVAFTPVIRAEKSEAEYAARLELQPQQVAALRSFFDRPTASIHALPKLAFWRDYFRILQGEQRRFPCALPSLVLNMSPEGDLYPCATSGLVYGNVYQRSVGEIWYSPGAKRIRRRIRDTFCAGCVSSNQASLSATEEVLHFGRFLAGEGLRQLSGRWRKRHETLAPEQR